MAVVNRAFVAALLVAGAFAFAGCTPRAHKVARGSPAPSAAPVESTTTATSAVTVAEARVPSVAVFRAPGDATPWLRLPNPNEDGAQRVFLVKGDHGYWLDVLLPVRPNGTRGWIRAADVEVTTTDWRIKIELNAHRITGTQGTDVFLRVNLPGFRGGSIFRREDGAHGLTQAVST